MKNEIWKMGLIPVPLSILKKGVATEGHPYKFCGLTSCGVKVTRKSAVSAPLTMSAPPGARDDVEQRPRVLSASRRCLSLRDGSRACAARSVYRRLGRANGTFQDSSHG